MIPDLNPVFSFLLPSFNTHGNENLSTFILQWVFFVVIWLSAGITIYRVKESAQSSRWERNWRGESGHKGYLDAEHGSVHDISSAVATPAEKLAEMLPSLLLVIGLLGTFIGLGLALNIASSIFLKANANGETANIMNDLLGMMNGLGMKFKTSTWGILAFLSMNIFNAINGFEKRRLAWVVGKMRSEMDERRQKKIDREKTTNQSILTGLHAVGAKICSSLEKQDKSLQAIVVANQETSKEIKAFLTTNTENLNSMKESASKMSQAATKAGSTADALAVVVKNFDQGVQEVLHKVELNLNRAITSLDEGLRAKIDQMATNLQTATTGISTAVGQLSTEITKALTDVTGSVSTSLDMQKAALLQFSSIVKALEENVQKSTENLNNIGEKIKLGLDAVSNSGLKMVRLGEDIKESLKEMKELRVEALSFYETLSNKRMLSSNPDIPGGASHEGQSE